jgi:hypothetical protein
LQAEQPVAAATLSWNQITADQIAVRMPGAPEESTTRVTFGDAIAHPHLVSYQNSAEKTLISYMTFDRPVNGVEYLNGVRDYFAGGRPLIQEQDLLLGGHPTKWMKGEFQGKMSLVLLVSVGRKLYQVLFQSSDYMTELFDGHRFFDSFRLYDAYQVCGVSVTVQGRVSALCQPR